MSKGYWISAYREIKDPEKLKAYAELAGPAVKAGGGRFLVRGGKMKAYEAGVEQRTVVVEFDSFEAAVATHDGAAYKAALGVLEGAVVRDFRIVEGAE